MKAIFTPLKNKFANLYFAAEYVMEEDFVPWNTKIPLYDVVDRSNAEYLFCELNQINSEVFSVLKNTDIKLVVFGIGIQEEILSINQPALICCPKNITKHIKTQINAIGKPVLYLMDSANIVHFNKKTTSIIESEVGYLAINETKEYTDYKYMIDTLRLIGVNDIKLKVLGSKLIPIIQYLGYLHPHQFINFYQNTKINLDFEGLNILDIAISNSFCLSNVPNTLYPNYTNHDEMLNMIEDFFLKPNARKKIAQRAFDLIIDSDTSLHRIKSIFEALNLNDLAKKTQTKLEEIKNEIRNND